MRAVWLGLAVVALPACGRRWVRLDHMVVQPGSTCHVLLELDDWQYPQDDRLGAQVTGLDALPVEVRRCLSSGISLERTERPRLAELLARRLHELGWLDAKVEVPAEGPLSLVAGTRYDFGAVRPGTPDSRVLAEAFSEALGEPSPYDWSRVIAAQERVSRKKRCTVDVRVGEGRSLIVGPCLGPRSP